MSEEPRRRNRTYWDAQARDNAAWHISHSGSEEDFRESGHRDARKVFGQGLDALPESGRVLEIGCGIGRVLSQLCNERIETQLFGIDVSTEMVRQANERVKGHSNVLIFRCGGDTLDMFDDAYFDFVYSLMVFQHLPQPTFRSYARDVGRVLKPNGVFRFQVQFDRDQNGLDPHPADDFRSIRYYDVNALRNILPASLEIIDYPSETKSSRVHDYYVTAHRKVV